MGWCWMCIMMCSVEGPRYQDLWSIVYISRFKHYSYLSPGGWGHWPWKGVWWCAAVMTPFFQATWRSLAYQFTIIAPLLCPPPPFSNFRKIFDFQPCFGQNFSSQDANFSNFRSLDPSFFKENPLPRPYFWKPVWHTPTKKKVECPPGSKPEVSGPVIRACEK